MGACERAADQRDIIQMPPAGNDKTHETPSCRALQGCKQASARAQLCVPCKKRAKGGVHCVRVRLLGLNTLPVPNGFARLRIMQPAGNSLTAQGCARRGHMCEVKGHLCASVQPRRSESTRAALHARAPKPQTGRVV